MNHDISSGAAPRARRLGLWAVLIGLALACAPCLQARIWGINGLPDRPEYRVWNYKYVEQQMYQLKDLGCKYYRVSFQESRNDPWVLDWIVPKARDEGIQIVPIIFKQPVPGDGFDANYHAGYTHARMWADYALNKGYVIPYWELGNETSLAKTEPGDVPFFWIPTGLGVLDQSLWTDRVNGATDAMAGMLRGLYWGVHDAYKDRAPVKCLFGDTWLHYGYVKKIMAVRGANFFPGDMVSWHWYTPKFSSFTAPISNTNPRSPYSYVQELALIKGVPTDIWMTEVGREDLDRGKPVGGSAVNFDNNNENWPLQASELTSELTNLVTSAPQVKGIFVFELYDRRKLTYQLASQELRSSQGFYGLMTPEYPNEPDLPNAPAPHWYFKTGYDTYKTFIRNNP